MAQHGIVKCSCGEIIFQCRCPEVHNEVIREADCPKCRFEKANIETYYRVAKEAAEDLGRIMAFLRVHFPEKIQQRKEMYSSELVIQLLSQLLPPTEEVSITQEATYY